MAGTGLAAGSSIRGATRLTESEGPGTESISYRRMSAEWELIHDLLGGTTKMRASRTTWLPQEPREKDGQYEIRLNRSFLYNALGNTVERIVSKPFSRTVTVGPDLLPPGLDMIEQDADFDGADLTSVARKLFEDGVSYGWANVLVDYPTVSTDLDLATERATRIHPYFVPVSPLNLISVSVSSDPVSGRTKIRECRIKEKAIVASGEFGEREVTRVLHIRSRGADVQDPGTWTRWEYNPERTTWNEIDTGPFTYPGDEIPMVRIPIGKKKSDTEADPPLRDLADLNLAHWQSLSDQRNILRFARLPILFQTGISEEEAERPVILGPVNVIRSVNSDAKMVFVEHSGKAIDAGAKDLKELEERMEVLGLQPFLQSSSGTTATEVGAHESRTMTSIQAWIRSLEDGLSLAYDFAATWLGEELPSDFSIDIFNEFGLSLRAIQDIKELQATRARGDITHETFLRELKRRSVLSDDVNIDEEIQRLSQGMDGAIPSPDPILDDDEADEWTTTEVDGHTHTFYEGDTQTSTEDGHTHGIAWVDGVPMIEDEDGHSHEAR